MECERCGFSFKPKVWYYTNCPECSYGQLTILDKVEMVKISKRAELWLEKQRELVSG